MKKHLLLYLCVGMFLTNYAQRPFITMWDTRKTGISDSMHVNFYATGNDFQVSWINVNNTSDTGNTIGTSGANNLLFPEPGIYKIYVTPGSGNFSAIMQNISDDSTNSDCKKLISIEQWGDIEWSTFNAAFANCYSMVMNAQDIPNLSNVKDMSYAFFRCSLFATNPAMSSWDVSNVTNMSGMFDSVRNFNQPIGDWDVHNVTNMSYMFKEANHFNQSIDTWAVSNVTNMNSMFYNAYNFNQFIDDWDVSNVTDMSSMFSIDLNFDQYIGDWNVSKVTNMSHMFENAYHFNQPIGSWDVSNVTDMREMFEDSRLFNQPIDAWNVSNVTNMSRMFYDALSFNQPIGDWNVGNVTDMSYMFYSNYNSISFNQPIGNWDVSQVRNMQGMFEEEVAFNQDISHWNTGNVNLMSGMFSAAISFNQPIGDWDVSKVTDMSGMFLSAFAFNQPLYKWNVRSVNNMALMFEDAKVFNQDIGSWNLSSSPFMAAMFDQSGMNCSNYSFTLKGWAGSASTPNGLSLGAAGLIYDSVTAKASHDSLVNIKHWTITGDTISNCSGILPMTFIAFTAMQKGNTALLNWRVANEINVEGYYVEKSVNTLNYISMNFLPATSKSTYYTFTDNNINEGITYYRIKEVDNDGRYLYSSIQKLAYSKFIWKINGNPINNSSVSLTLDKAGVVSIQIISSNGNVIKAIQKGKMMAGDYNIPLNINNASTGVYLVRLTVDDKVYTTTVIK